MTGRPLLLRLNSRSFLQLLVSYSQISQNTQFCQKNGIHNKSWYSVRLGGGLTYGAFRTARHAVALFIPLSEQFRGGTNYCLGVFSYFGHSYYNVT